jgi:hypothetical protein
MLDAIAGEDGAGTGRWLPEMGEGRIGVILVLGGGFGDTTFG